MSVKQEIINRINEIDDSMVLDEILRLVSVKPNNETVYHFTKDERKSVEEGLEDLDAGRFYTNEKANKLIATWLSEQSIGLKGR